MSIPFDVISTHVYPYLCVSDIINLSMTCKDYQETNHVWQYLMKRDFNKDGDKESYKKLNSQIIHFQNYRGTSVWKPRVGNHVTKYVGSDRYPFTVTGITTIKGVVTLTKVRRHGNGRMEDIRLIKSKTPRWVDVDENGPKYYSVYVPGQLIYKLDPGF